MLPKMSILRVYTLYLGIVRSQQCFESYSKFKLVKLKKINEKYSSDAFINDVTLLSLYDMIFYGGEVRN